jgi:hypothetical protein
MYSENYIKKSLKNHGQEPTKPTRIAAFPDGPAPGLVETRAAEPMLPLHVFRNRNFSLSMGLTFLTGLAMFGAMTFLPLYRQTAPDSGRGTADRRHDPADQARRRHHPADHGPAWVYNRIPSGVTW